MERYPRAKTSSLTVGIRHETRRTVDYFFWRQSSCIVGLSRSTSRLRKRSAGPMPTSYAGLDNLMLPAERPATHMTSFLARSL